MVGRGRLAAWFGALPLGGSRLAMGSRRPSLSLPELMMRKMTWTLGLTLGAITGAAALEVGILDLLLLVPAVAWAARERCRPAGLGGLIVGLGAGAAGLLEFANLRCAASNVSGPDFSTECVMPDLTSYLVGAAIVVAIGIVVSLAAAPRSRRAATA